MSLNPQDQRKIADELISLLQVIDPSCIVAGGCVRDWFCDKSAKDIDIFMYDGEYSMSVNKSRIEKILQVKMSNLSKEYTQSVSDNLISAVFEFCYKDQLINIIMWKKKTFNVTQTFPAYNVKMHYLPKYGDDKSRWIESLIAISYLYCKEIYVTEEINKKYWQKLRDKFPDCKIVMLNDRTYKYKVQVSKALRYVTDMGCPTEAEIMTAGMVDPNYDLTRPWLEGIDITKEEDFVMENTKRKLSLVKSVLKQNQVGEYIE